MSAPLLEVNNLETYYGPIMAIRGVSLKVSPGEIVAVLGANGAGKTTLLKTISGALNCRKGEILLEGRAVQNRDPDWVAAQGVAHVPEGREVFPFLTVRENLLLGAYRRRDAQGIADDLEAVCGYFPALKDSMGKLAGYLSGGQQQMLAIGRGCMSRPRLMLLDEPSLGLSPVLVTPPESGARHHRAAGRAERRCRTGNLEPGLRDGGWRGGDGRSVSRPRAQR